MFARFGNVPVCGMPERSMLEHTNLLTFPRRNFGSTLVG